VDIDVLSALTPELPPASGGGVPQLPKAASKAGELTPILVDREQVPNREQEAGDLADAPDGVDRLRIHERRG
jgi:hypothetical protein